MDPIEHAVSICLLVSIPAIAVLWGWFRREIADSFNRPSTQTENDAAAFSFVMSSITAPHSW